MAESTLALTFDDLCAEVGLFLGYGRGESKGDTVWDSYQQSVIESVVRSGVRQFYFPEPLDKSGSSYDWSFLKPTSTLTLSQGENTLALPDDFGGIEGQITLSTSSSTVTWPVPVVGEGMIRQRYAELPEATGQPRYAAMRPLRLDDDPAQGQRQELYVFPMADVEYTLQLQYYILPDCLSGDYPYAYGGAAHAETILESCLSVAEERLDDVAAVHRGKYLARLAASISMDRRLKPQLLGQNLDRSDELAVDHRNERRLYGSNSILYNGRTY